MDRINREVAEQRDAEAEKQMEKKLRELQDSASGKLDEAISHAATQHLRNLDKIKNEQDTFKEAVDKLKEEDEKEHQAKKADLLKKTEEKLANVTIRCDAVTKAALDNLDEATQKMTQETLKLEKDNVEAKAKTVEIEVNVGRQMFDEVGAQRDKDEFLSEKRTEEINNQYAAIQKEEETVLAAERSERKKNATMTIAEMRTDLAEQQKLGLFNLAIQHSADERKSRRQINSKIREVLEFAQDMDQCFGRAFVVLNATPENYAKVKPGRKRATKAHLVRFSELLSAISNKLCDIDQNLASFEWKDVEMTIVSRQIRTQVSSFGPIIANLTLILEIDDIPIDPAKTEQFAKAKEVLFEQINCLEVISEKREKIVEAITDRQVETMPTVEVMAIEN